MNKNGLTQPIVDRKTARRACATQSKRPVPLWYTLVVIHLTGSQQQPTQF